MALNAADDAPMVDVMRGAQRRSGRPDAIAEQRRNAAAIEVWEGLMEVNTEDPDIEFALDRMRVRARKFV
jgi:vacuolar-type H+-ATPase subunit B/Vma2